MSPATMFVRGTSAVGIIHSPCSVRNRSEPNFGQLTVHTLSRRLPTQVVDLRIPMLLRVKIDHEIS